MDIIVTLKQVPDPEAPKESFKIDDVAMKILNPANVCLLYTSDAADE